MVVALNYQNSHLFGPAFGSQFKLRHQGFLERQSYNVSSYEGMEYDQYDNPSCVYLVYKDDKGKALGVSRLTPVIQQCMLKDLMPEMVLDKNIFTSPTVWEGTRFCVDKAEPAKHRELIIKSLVVGYFEYGLERGITKIIGMMPTLIWKKIFQANGCECEILGPIKIIDGQKVQAVSMDINERTYRQVLQKTSLKPGIIENIAF